MQTIHKYTCPSGQHNNENNVCETLSNCVIEIKNWMTANLIQLNTDKTELNIFDTRQMLLNLRKTNCNIGGDIIDLTSCALNATKVIVQAFVCSRIDFNNSLYYGLPQKQIQRLQRIQNCAARLIFRKRKFDHITHNTMSN